MGLKQTVVLFDNAHRENMTTDESSPFRVTTARPKFATSDDLLVYWATEIKNGRDKSLDAKSIASALFVTSDRGLCQRLHAQGNVYFTPPLSLSSNRFCSLH